MSFVSRSDAIVALRSFGRRYADAINGPVGDDAWDRLVRTPDSVGHSALGYTAGAIAELDELTSVLAAFSTSSTHSFGTVAIVEPNTSVGIADIQTHVKASASAAADALDARRDEDYEATVTASGAATTLGAHVSEVVSRLAAGVRSAEAAAQQ